MRAQFLLSTANLLIGFSLITVSVSAASAQTCSSVGHPGNRVIGQIDLDSRPTRSNVRDYSELLKQLPPDQPYFVSTASNSKLLETFEFNTNSNDPADDFKRMVEVNQPDTAVFSISSPWSGTHEFSRVALEYERSKTELKPESLVRFEQILAAAPHQEFALDLFQDGIKLDQTFDPAIFSNSQDIAQKIKEFRLPENLIITSRPRLVGIPGMDVPGSGNEGGEQNPLGPPIDGQTQGGIDVVPVIPPSETTPSSPGAVIPSDCIETPCPEAQSANVANQVLDITKRKKIQIIDATVMITFKKAQTTGGAKFDRCNGINLGEGRIVTAAHCFTPDTEGHVVWFGNIEWGDKHEDGPRRSELACEVDKIGDLKTSSLTGNELPLDAILLSVPDLKNYETGTKFLESPIYIPTKDPWCHSENNCDDPTQNTLPFKQLSVSQAWAADPDKEVIQDGFENYTYKRGIKTLSANHDGKSCGTRLYEGGTLSSGILRLACAAHRERDLKISSFGFVHDCDTLAGSSGAPVFLQTDINDFVSGQEARLPLAGLHRAGDLDLGNCAIPATQLQSLINP